MSANAPNPGREAEFTIPIGLTDDEGRIHKVAVLRKMTGREEAILADRRNQRNGGKLVSELIASCLVRLGELPKGGSNTVERMYSADRNFLLLKLRTLTFGPELQATYTCGTCGESIQVVEDLDQLPVKMLQDGESPDEIIVNLQDGYLDKDGQVHTALTLRLPRGDDESAVAPQMRQNPSLGKNALLSRCLKSLGDVPRHRLEALGPKILADLTMTDRRLIDRALNTSAPGVDLVREVVCGSCGGSFRATLDMTNFLALA
ncbi:hypothetical protein [Pyxidicoccus caerfyrddinensis]|uniref:T4 family baseplate hub assembly chaperone n=1 Tax=Pyxidicoccus caerfyrddinensis TaxID=2709663 RepID=UPI0013D9B14B|nr:hypothetical protein [Pyxidicoccus caerfyrddinensis]